MSALAGLRSVVALYDCIETDSHMDIVMELCATDLFHSLSIATGGVQHPDLARELILQLIDAVSDCHARGVFHRDLKPENILVSETDLCLKLVDFGLASHERLSSQFGCGSLRYMAPECASPVLLAAFAPYDCCLDDIWSVGILVLNILTAKNPWEVADPAVDANYATYLTVNRADSLANTFGLTPETARVVAGLLHPNPARRWSLSRARRHVASISTFIAPPPS
ncbi:kinase-like domain-containing protein, partial [Entophlyctis helioformis]